MDLKIRVMKIKGLLFGLFACAALAACTNEDIVDNNGKEIEKVKANVTLSIGTASNSSRSTDNEEGDATETTLAKEATITDAVIVIAPSGNQTVGVTDYLESVTVSGSLVEKSYQIAEGGQYKVLVVLNPSKAVTNIVSSYSQTAEAATKAYAAILACNAGDVDAVTGGAERNHFMMANQEEKTINVTSNDAENPSLAVDINVERVASKICFKPAQDNKYTVPTAVTHIVPATSNGAWYDETAKTWKLISMLNHAKTVDGTSIWIYQGAEGDEFSGFQFTMTEKKHIVNGTKAPIVTKNSSTVTDYTLVKKGSTTDGVANWSVTLDQYALVNLSNTVYAVRHKTASNWAEPTVLGLLSNSEYIVDPTSAAKNAITLTEDGRYGETTTLATTFFTNTLAEVEETQYTTEGQYFQDMPTGDDQLSSSGNEGYKFMSYCLENSVIADKQKMGLITGIIFRGKIADADGEPVGTIYKHQSQFYRDEAALKAENIKVEDAEEYTNGYCYYYAPIEHAKTQEGAEAGVMKKAIMRNNIYALSISSFSQIGYSRIDLIPGNMDGDKAFYLKLSAKILPWQVRFNNIKF